MKRFHLHLHVIDLAANIGFYSKLFSAEPTRVEPDYAKWMPQVSPVNFAISTRGQATGVDHLGIQTDDPTELVAVRASAQAADLALRDDGLGTCCYARSEKHRITDLQGIAWEHFHTLESIPVFNESTPVSTSGACCAGAASRSSASRKGRPVGIPVKATSACC
jgi:hypothetical protein